MGKNISKNLVGFTLVELTIVIALIGILAAGLLATIDPLTQLKKGRDSRRKQDMEQLRRGLETYKNDQASPIYPATANWDTTLETAKSMNKVPCDPVDGCTGTYKYSYTLGASDDLTYTLIACLENVNDPNKDATNNEGVCGTGRRSYTKVQP